MGFLGKTSSTRWVAASAILLAPQDFGFAEKAFSWEERMISQADGLGRIKALFGVLTVLIFYFFFFGCSSRPKTDSPVESSSSTSLISHERRVDTFKGFEEVIAYVKASNTGAGDKFGISLSLSADGNTLAVGAFGEASNAQGIGGDQTNNEAKDSGAVYLFKVNRGL